MIRVILKLMVALLCCIPPTSVLAENTFTAPETVVDVKIEPTGNGNAMVFTGVKLFFETVPASYHVESQRSRPDLANRNQDVALLQSKVVRFGTHQLKFQSVIGEALDLNTVQSRLKDNPLVLLLPAGASIHPQLAAALKAETIVVIRRDGRATRQRLVPRPDGE